MSIHARNLNYTYNLGTVYEHNAIKNVSFDIEGGEFIGVIGHTASGKSTLMQILNGLIKFDSGSLEVCGYKFNSENVNLSELRKKVGLVFQYPEYQLFEDTVELDVSFGPKNLAYPEEKIEKSVTDALEIMGLNTEEIRKSSPFELSGGQKRKVAIAGILAMNPEVLIMDEPSSGLDPKARSEMLDIIKKEHERTKRITIIVSHDMRDIAKIADKIIVMNKGNLYAYGTPREIFKQRDELLKIGLDLPEISHLSDELNKNGFNIDLGIYDIEEWADIVAKQIKMKKEENRNKGGRNA